MRSPVRFGFKLSPAIDGQRATLNLTKLADENRVDYVALDDFPFNSGYLDSLSLIAWLASRTTQVSFLSYAATAPLRPPALLAKQAATLSVLTGGRFTLGLERGVASDQIVSMGGPNWPDTESLRALNESIDILRASWRGETFSYSGEFYQLDTYTPGPVPTEDIPVWVAAHYHDELELVGKKADGWLTSGAPKGRADRLQRAEIIESAASQHGRSERVSRIYTVNGMIHHTALDTFVGPAEKWCDDIIKLHQDENVDTILFSPHDQHDEQLRLFAEQVIPAVRSQLRG